MRGEPYAKFNVKAFKPTHIRAIVDQRAATPARANHILRLFRILFAYAIDIGWLNSDPTQGIKRLRMKEKGVEAWTEEQIRQYEDHWQIGTRQRLAFAILLYTGQRRSDVVEIGPKALQGDTLRIRQIKTGADLVIPIHPALAEAIVATGPHEETYLRTERGEKWSSNGFYNQFVKWCAAAGVPPGCSPHGLRKAAARRLAEAGCSTHQIASITGHATLAEIERYTKSAQQAKLAEDAIRALQKSQKG